MPSGLAGTAGPRPELLGSGYLLVGDGATPLGQLGLTADAAVLLLIAHRGEWVTDERVHPSRRVLNVESIAAVLAVALLTGLVLARPWFMRWGSTTSELQATWPGDELVLDANYLSQHAVTIRAPPSAVWPWLAQLGQNRAGFYSYAWLENLFGLGVRNADRIHPEQYIFFLWSTDILVLLIVEQQTLVALMEPLAHNGSTLGVAQHRAGQDEEVVELEPAGVPALAGGLEREAADGRAELEHACLDVVAGTIDGRARRGDPIAHRGRCRASFPGGRFSS